MHIQILCIWETASSFSSDPNADTMMILESAAQSLANEIQRLGSSGVSIEDISSVTKTVEAAVRENLPYQPWITASCMFSDHKTFVINIEPSNETKQAEAAGVLH
jgi:hypothetical protein